MKNAKEKLLILFSYSVLAHFATCRLYIFARKLLANREQVRWRDGGSV